MSFITDLIPILKTLYVKYLDKRANITKDISINKKHIAYVRISCAFFDHIETTLPFLGNLPRTATFLCVTTLSFISKNTMKNKCIGF